MATEFSLTIRHDDPEYARGAAQAVWDEIDRLENLLSRFREGSDIYCINHCDAGVTLPLREETDTCLRLAVRVMQATQGLFDIGVGGLSEALEKNGIDSVPAMRTALEAKTRGSLMLHEDSPHITVLEPGVKLDLGAIGKGFAVDWTQGVLTDYEIDSYLLSSGGSSVWANAPTDGDYWNIRLAGDSRSYFFHAHQCAVSASGTGVKGAHIVHPQKGLVSQYLHKRCWAICQSGAIADALSTAGLLLPSPEIERALRELGERAAVVLEPLEKDAPWEFISYPEGALAPENPEDPDSAWVLR